MTASNQKWTAERAKAWRRDVVGSEEYIQGVVRAV